MVNVQEQVEKFQQFLEINYQKEIVSLIKDGKKSLLLNFQDIAKFDHGLAEETLNDPEDTITAAEIALSHFEIPGGVVRVRLSNLPESQNIKIKNIRSEHMDKLIAIDGIVRQASDVRPQLVSAKFECPACGNLIKVPQTEQKIKEPSRCNCGRRGRFRVVERDIVDSQRLILEESPDALEGGGQPKRFSIFLREDLVEPAMEKKTTPGSKVRATGLVKEVPIPAKTGGHLTRFDLILEVNQIEPVEESYEDIEITPEDEAKIKQLSKDPKVYEKLVSSIAPSVFGHEDIKGSLVLQLMGGVRKTLADGTVTKGDIHLLLVGDPGAAKSTILKFMEKVAPKCRYVAGRGASSAGITATVVKDEFLRGWALEAGAIVLANGGFLLLDEMDKMSADDTSALHEAMAQQQVTISKANIQATLRAQTSVIAAANPKFGRFDPYQPIPSQINLPPALINRFDLIFPVRDMPSKEKDNKIATHVLRQQKEITANEPEISQEFLKKYVAYVRQNVNPKLTDGAIEEIKEFYVNLRNSSTQGDESVKPIPISARQLEALVRLSEASARVRISKKVLRSDARNAISIMRHCLMQVGFDPETGQIDIDRISSGITTSQRSKIFTIREIISHLESRGKKTIPVEDIVAEAVEKKISEAQIEEIIDKLKREGEIYEPRRGFISKI